MVHHSRGYDPAPQAIFFKERKVTRVAPRSLAAAMQEGTFGFAGVDDHYFLSALVDVNQPIRVDYQPLDGKREGRRRFASWSARFPSPPHGLSCFVGLKDSMSSSASTASGSRDRLRDVLLAGGAAPARAQGVNSYVGNYGWSLRSCSPSLINLEMFPLRHKRVVSMRKMQQIQPEVKAIQDRYAKLKMSDPAKSKMNVEVMNLYRERGVNPASGCVPMLLAHAGPLRVLFDAGGCDGAARRAGHALDSRPGRAQSFTTSCPCSWASRCSCSSG